MKTWILIIMLSGGKGTAVTSVDYGADKAACEVAALTLNEKPRKNVQSLVHAECIPGPRK